MIWLVRRPIKGPAWRFVGDIGAPCQARPADSCTGLTARQNFQKVTGPLVNANVLQYLL